MKAKVPGQFSPKKKNILAPLAPNEIDLGDEMAFAILSMSRACSVVSSCDARTHF